ncbi:MAG: endopeptidase La [Proteobacteria bacterium]|nr:endopeptidase La [Pseudomonadota bacterium]
MSELEQNQQTERRKPELPEDVIIVLPVRDTVLYPGMVMPLSVGRRRSIAAIQEAVKTDRPVAVVMQKAAEEENPGPDDLHRYATLANVLRFVTTGDGSHHLIAQGEQRIRLLEFIEGQPFLLARYEVQKEPLETGKEVEARMLTLRQRAHAAIDLLPQAPDALKAGLDQIDSASLLADSIAFYLDLKPEEKQDVLETVDLIARMDRVQALLEYRLEVLQLQNRISERTRESISLRQREALLREQLKSIQQELGEDDEESNDLQELEEAIGKAGMPEDTEEHARRELKRLQRVPPASPEYSMTRTYLEWLSELPWSKTSDDHIDIENARKVLDEDHYGLEKIKKRILEYLAVRKLNPKGRSPILCFVGPPGVGKTSLGQSIARATGREFGRASLGGIHDEAEIRGHRRTYVGAMPGMIIQHMKKAGAKNPVIMLDEMDKLGQGFHGDPSSALLEVLDPAQNSTFRDNYLGVPFDLSQVMFIGTANVLHNIPGPLRDRMEVIELPGYTHDEKVEIAKRYLVKRQLEAAGISPEQCTLTDEALDVIVGDYTREAGVRNLEREVGAVIRNAAVEIAEGKSKRITIDAERVRAVLGPPKFEDEVAMRTSVPGVATGMAWTPVGGDILFIEANRSPGKGRLILTGQLGDVMKESAQAALTLLKNRAGSLGIAMEDFETNDVHVHVPAGAIPKDGPSAGVAMYTALASLFTNRTVRSDVSMTGEISLRGLVMPVGGIKEKVLAAHRAGIKSVMLPARNKRDFEEIPQRAREELEFVWLEHVEQALDHALSREPETERRTGTR